MMIMMYVGGRSLKFWRVVTQFLLMYTAWQPRRFCSSKHMFISYYQDAEQNHNIKMGNRSIKHVMHLKYVRGGATVTNAD